MTDEKKRIEEHVKARERARVYFEEKSPVYRAFTELETQAFREGSLDRKTKELIAVAISVIVKCEPCMEHHVREALERGATEQQVLESLEVAIEMGGGPATAQARFALSAMEHYRAG
jgi:AhpD family alkylhydroperoxidase